MCSVSDKRKVKRGWNSHSYSYRSTPYAAINRPQCSTYIYNGEEISAEPACNDSRQPRHETSVEENDSLNNIGGSLHSNRNVRSTTILYENDSLLEIVRRICQETVDNDRVPEKFIKYITTFLLSVTDILPEDKIKIHKIISFLGNIGVNYDNIISTGGPDFNSLLNSFQVSHDCRNIHHKCELFSMLSQLIKIDKHIQKLQDEKLRIYNVVLSSRAKQVILVSDSESERCDDLQYHNDSGQIYPRNSETEQSNIHHFVEKSEFSKDVVELAIQKIEKNIDIKKEDIEGTVSIQSNVINKDNHGNSQIEHSLTEHNVQLNENISSDETNHQKVIPMNDSLSPLPLIPKQNNERDPIDTRIIIDFHENPSVLIKVQQYEIVIMMGQKKCCFAGCRDGTVCIFCLETGALFDIIKKHSDSVTSIITWDLKVITSSLDGRVCLLNPATKVSRGLNIGEPINCAVENCGVLYLGTAIGSIIKVNIRSMTHISSHGSQLQVSPTAILDIQVFQDRHGPSIIVAAKGKPVAVRNAENGDLLFSLKELNDCATVGMISTSSLIYCGANQNNTFFASISSGKEALFSKEYVGANRVHVVNQHFFVGGNDGKIRVYNSKALLIYVVSGPGRVITYFTIHKKKIIICYDSHLIISVKFPDQLRCLLKASKSEEF